MPRTNHSALTISELLEALITEELEFTELINEELEFIELAAEELFMDELVSDDEFATDDEPDTLGVMLQVLLLVKKTIFHVPAATGILPPFTP